MGKGVDLESLNEFALIGLALSALLVMQMKVGDYFVQELKEGR